MTLGMQIIGLLIIVMILLAWSIYTHTLLAKVADNTVRIQRLQTRMIKVLGDMTSRDLEDALKAAKE